MNHPQQHVDGGLREPAFDTGMTIPRITGEAGSPREDAFDVWIDAGRGQRHYWRDLWHYRELFLILTWRNVAVRYKQTVAGAAWALLQPVFAIAVMTLIFERMAGLRSEGDAPYALMVAAGVLPWQFFAASLGAASQSLLTDAALVSKVYFPRAVLPASSLAASLFDFLVACAVVAALMVWYGYVPTSRVVWVPVLLVAAALATLGPCLLVSALIVRYRDFRFVFPFVIQFGLYVSPVAYSSALVRERFGETWFLVYSLNPISGVIDAFRWAILRTAPIDSVAFALSMSVASALLVIGASYFRRVSRTFADVI